MRTWIGALALAAAVAPGCKGKKQAAPARRDAGGDDAAAQMSREERPPETVLVTELAIQRVDPDDPVAVDDNLLARELGMMLAASEPFAATPDDVPAGRRAAQARVVATINHDIVSGAAGRA